MKDLFVFIGPPGAGKGSLSGELVEKLGWVQLSTGDLFRRHIAEQTEIGKQIDFAIKSGKLVSDALVTDMVAQWLTQNLEKASTVILDGYPRTAVQAQALNELLRDKLSLVKLHVMRLFIPMENIVKRLTNRYICSNKECQAVYSLNPDSSMIPKNDMICDKCGSPLVRREDDEESTVRERLAGYAQHEEDLLKFYHETEQDILELDADGRLEDVFEKFKKLIGLNT